MKSVRADWTIAFASAVAIVACGGSVVTVGGGSDSGTGTDGGTGDSPSGPFCPAKPPGAGSSCAPVGLQCEYGTDPSPDCNTIMQCGASGWVNLTTGTVCPPPGTQCPSSYASVPDHQKCTPDLLTCPYAEGVCICTSSLGGPVSLYPMWDCFPAQSGCPSPRPHLGAPCSPSGQECNYGACSGGIDLICKDGYWQEQQLACPV
jgi:hypothetical protein